MKGPKGSYEEASHGICPDCEKKEMEKIKGESHNLFDALCVSVLNEKKKKMKNPCWKGYKPIGTKMKDGKEVPNCVPVDEAARCTKVTGKASSDRKDKKYMKCVKSGSGYKRIHWGDPNAKVTGKSGNTARKKSFRARHKCSTAKPGTPKYQACKDW